jgi:glucose uptake protein GlcU
LNRERLLRISSPVRVGSALDVDMATRHTMSYNHIVIGIVGIIFTNQGILMRKQQKKDWRIVFFGGITMIVVVILSLVFGFSL